MGTLKAVRAEWVVLSMAALGECLSGCSSVARAEERKSPAIVAPAVMSIAGAALAPSRSTATSAADADGDGIDDARELELAKSYFPYYSLSPREECGRHGVLFRLSPHPADAKKIAISYVVLYERDCGLRGIGAHIGDDEAFGEIIDPSVPAPAGILGIVAISHQNTTCERVSSCGTLPGCTPCSTAQKDGKPYPVVFSSLSKHGTYADEGTCNHWPCDLFGCSLNATADTPPFVNAGEPAHHLSENLTTDGFVGASRGWTEPSLMNFNPWSSQKFGRAGNVTDDLVDPSFLVSPNGC
jgi:hypothetical protein